MKHVDFISEITFSSYMVYAFQKFNFHHYVFFLYVQFACWTARWNKKYFLEKRKIGFFGAKNVRLLVSVLADSAYIQHSTRTVATPNERSMGFFLVHL